MAFFGVHQRWLYIQLVNEWLVECVRNAHLRDGEQDSRSANKVCHGDNGQQRQHIARTGGGKLSRAERQIDEFDRDAVGFGGRQQLARACYRR